MKWVGVKRTGRQRPLGVSGGGSRVCGGGHPSLRKSRSQEKQMRLVRVPYSARRIFSALEAAGACVCVCVV